MAVKLQYHIEAGHLALVIGILVQLLVKSLFAENVLCRELVKVFAQVAALDIVVHRIQEFFQIITDLQLEEVEKCLEIYEMVSLTLIQCESLILHSSSGKSSLMSHFYINYSEKIFGALKKSLLKSIDDLQSFLRGELQMHFFMTSYLENGDIKLHPPCDELFDFVKVTLIQTFAKLKYLREWENGSCLPKQNSTELFYQRLINDEEMKIKSKLVLEDLKNLCDSLQGSMKQWLKYDVLWKYDKDATIEQFASKKPELSDYENQLDYYTNIASKIEQEQQISEVRCIKVEVAQLMNQLKNHCTEWKNKLGYQLAVDTKQITVQINGIVQRLSSTLNSDIAHERDLTAVLASINEAEAITTDVMIKFYKIEEHYHELQMQNLKTEEEDIIAFNKVKLTWEKMHDRCLYKKFVLEFVKISTKDTMERQIREFQHRCDQFVTRFRQNKNKMLSSEYDITIQILMEYSKECSVLCDEQLQAKQIQECFEISYFQPQHFYQVKSDIEELKQKFKLL